MGFISYRPLLIYLSVELSPNLIKINITMIKKLLLGLSVFTATTFASPVFTQDLAPIHGIPHVEGLTDPRVHNSYIVVLKDNIDGLLSKLTV